MKFVADLEKLLSDIMSAESKEDCVKIIKDTYIQQIEYEIDRTYDMFTHTAHSKGAGYLETMTRLRKKQAEIRER